MQAQGHNGVQLTVPPPVPGDWRDRLALHLQRLSPESRLNRFLAGTSLAAMARHAAVTLPSAVVEARIAGETRGMAEVHVRSGAVTEAEIALSVEDGWQRRGVGAALFAQAVHEARRLGAREIYVYYLRTNSAMRKIARRAGFVEQSDGDPSVVRAHQVAPHPGAGARRLH